MRMEALTQLTGELAHPPIHSCDENRNAIKCVRLRTEKRRHQIELEILSAKIESCAIMPAIPESSDGANYVPHFCYRIFPLDPEASLVVTLYLRAEPENKTTSGEFGEIPCEIGQDRRAACERHGDACP